MDRKKRGGQILGLALLKPETTAKTGHEEVENAVEQPNLNDTVITQVRRRLSFDMQPVRTMFNL